ncbi:HNH endonuclease [Pseudosulfitobacter sp. SM2401]|uniref:HNH endonuclease signature motif containing protein n=1 Tax=Pseudosulfitobacter sp. SM2401 TaxID=3350098 RepID=UPI0036F44EB2
MSKGRLQTPAYVARQLRQEAGFGCVVCGNPIIEYHHIVEWSERKHFEPEHMVVVCPTHHKELASQRSEVAYRYKKNPINIRKNRLKGYLFTKRKSQSLIIGSMRFTNMTSILTYGGNRIFGFDIKDEEIRLNLFIPNDKFNPLIEIKHNYVTSAVDDHWDIEFKPQWVKFRRKAGDVSLTVDFRQEDATISANFSILGQEFSFQKGKHLDIGHSVLGNLNMEYIGEPNPASVVTALGLGPSGRILRPNFAMARPQAVFLPSGRIWDPQLFP